MDLPEGIKPIGCKWVCKRKRRVDGKVETHKAKQVANGDGKKLGFDYEETFFLVAMIKSIRIISLVATNYDYEIWQSKITFLNGYLEESFYMMQTR